MLVSRTLGPASEWRSLTSVRITKSTYTVDIKGGVSPNRAVGTNAQISFRPLDLVSVGSNGLGVETEIGQLALSPVSRLGGSGVGLSGRT